MPPEFVVELALAHFLDPAPDSVTFNRAGVLGTARAYRGRILRVGQWNGQAIQKVSPQYFHSSLQAALLLLIRDRV